MPEDKEGILALPLEQRDDIIVCENVHKWFGEFCAVRDVSMTVKRGESSSSSARRGRANPHSSA